MEDDFSKALDALHNRIDGAIETTQTVSLNAAQSWTVPETKLVDAKEGSKAKTFLLQIFFVGLAIAGLYIV